MTQATSNGEKSVRARDVWHSYVWPGSHEHADLRGVALDVPPGSFVAVVGANGSGKTTFARHLNALVPLQEGALEVCGLDVSDASSTKELRRRCGMVFQNPENQFVSSVVAEDVAFGPQNFGRTADEAASLAADALAAVGLEGFGERDVHELSGGQQQRVALAGVLACGPEVVVLDEATSMLDPQSAVDVVQAVRDASSLTGSTVIAVTHDMELAAEADLVVVMSQGVVLAQGDPHDVLVDEELLAKAGLRAPVAVRTWRECRKRGICSDAPVPVTIAELAQEVAALCG